MEAMVGHASPFDNGRERMKVLAGLEVTAKSVERTAEGIGAHIAEGEQREIRKAVQLDLPSSSVSRFRFSMCKWTGPVCQL